MARLSWQGPKGKQEYELLPLTRVGRSSQNHVTLTDRKVSSFHARVRLTAEDWAVEDAGSTNGVFVNGERRRRCPLKDGDIVTLGDTQLTFDAPSAQDDAPPVSAEPATVGDAAPREKERDRSGPVPDAIAQTVTLDDARLDRVASSAVGIEASGTAVDVEDFLVLAKRLSACHEISRTIAGTLDLSAVLDQVLNILFELLPAAEHAFIFLLDPRTGETTIGAAKHRLGQQNAPVSVSRTVLGDAIETGRALLCRDTRSRARYAAVHSVAALGIRSVAVAPLLLGRSTLGAIYVDARSPGKVFTEEDLGMLSIVSSQVAVCVANVRHHERLVSSERLAAVGQTVAGLAHCIKNILQGVKGGSFIVEKALAKGDAERLQRGWEMVSRNNAFIEELMLDLLSYSKERKPEYQSTDLNALCGGVAELAAARGREAGVAVHFRPDPSLAAVEVDPKGIRRSVLNLATNAVDACAENKGAVTIETRAAGAQDGNVEIVVRDTGHGMSEETLKKLFTVFFSTKGSKGTGLGLPISNKIVAEHGGSIAVESRRGKGTTFTIALPPTPAKRNRQGETHGR